MMITYMYFIFYFNIKNDLIIIDMRDYFKQRAYFELSEY